MYSDAILNNKAWWELLSLHSLSGTSAMWGNPFYPKTTTTTTAKTNTLDYCLIEVHSDLKFIPNFRKRTPFGSDDRILKLPFFYAITAIVVYVKCFLLLEWHLNYPPHRSINAPTTLFITPKTFHKVMLVFFVEMT